MTEQQAKALAEQVVELWRLATLVSVIAKATRLPTKLVRQVIEQHKSENPTSGN
jgi:hypothetical protein